MAFLEVYTQEHDFDATAQLFVTVNCAGEQLCAACTSRCRLPAKAVGRPSAEQRVLLHACSCPDEMKAAVQASCCTLARHHISACQPADLWAPGAGFPAVLDGLSPQGAGSEDMILPAVLEARHRK